MRFNREQLNLHVDVGDPNIPIIIDQISLAQSVRFVSRSHQDFESQAP